MTSFQAARNRDDAKLFVMDMARFPEVKVKVKEKGVKTGSGWWEEGEGGRIKQKQNKTTLLLFGLLQ